MTTTTLPALHAQCVGGIIIVEGLLDGCVRQLCDALGVSCETRTGVTPGKPEVTFMLFDDDETPCVNQKMGEHGGNRARGYPEPESAGSIPARPAFFPLAAFAATATVDPCETLVLRFLHGKPNQNRSRLGHCSRTETACVSQTTSQSWRTSDRDVADWQGRHHGL